MPRMKGSLLQQGWSFAFCFLCIAEPGCCASTDAPTLTSLSLSPATNLTPTFSSSTRAYQAEVPTTIDVIKITPQLDIWQQAGAKVAISINGQAATLSQPTALNLSIGPNIVVIEVGFEALPGSTGSFYGLPSSIFYGVVPPATFYGLPVIAKSYYFLNTTRLGPPVLTSLSLSAGQICPPFNSSINSYSTTVGYTTGSLVAIYATPSKNADVSLWLRGREIIRPLIPAVGSNLISIYVTSQDRVTTTYTVGLTRLPLPYLNSVALSMGALIPTFSPSVLQYTATVGHTVGSFVTLNCTYTDPSIVHLQANGSTINNGSLSSPLTIGSNTIILTTLANDSSTLNYVIKIYRRGPPLLKSLALSAGILSPPFTSGVASYTALVADTLNAVSLLPVVLDSEDTQVTINESIAISNQWSDLIELGVGGTLLSITGVSKQDNTTYYYTLTITRPPLPALLSLTLASPTISINPPFVPHIYTYTLTAGYLSSTLLLNATTRQPTDTLLLNGTSFPVGGGVLMLPVGITSFSLQAAVTGYPPLNYTLTVTRKPPPWLKSLTLSLGSVSPPFNRGVFGYSLTVLYASSAVAVRAESADPKDTSVTAGGVQVASGEWSPAVELAVGNNSVAVVATAKDNATLTYTVTVLRLPSNTATLATLILTPPVALDPPFSPGGTSYAANYPYSVDFVSPVAAVTDPSAAALSVNGTLTKSGVATPPMQLTVGRMLLTITVVAQDNVTAVEYTVAVTRSAVLSLARLSLSGLTAPLAPLFSPEVEFYLAWVEWVLPAVTLPGGAALPAVAVTAATWDLTVELEINGGGVPMGEGLRQVAAPRGSSVVNVTVLSKANMTYQSRTYLVTLIRRPSTNALLSTLTLTPPLPLTPPFTPTAFSYSVTAPYSVRAVGAAVTAGDPRAQEVLVALQPVPAGATSELVPLKVGRNTLAVQVTAQDGQTTAVYVIAILRTPPSADASLAALDLNPPLPVSPPFSSAPGGGRGYRAAAPPEVSEVSVTPLTNDSRCSSVSVNGLITHTGQPSLPVALGDGNRTITIVVTAEDGFTTSIYTLLVPRAPNPRAPRLSDLSLSGPGGVALLLTPPFAPGGFSYTVVLGGGVAPPPAWVAVGATGAHAGAKIAVNGKVLASGSVSEPIPSTTFAPRGGAIVVHVAAAEGAATVIYRIGVVVAAPQAYQGWSPPQEVAVE